MPPHGLLAVPEAENIAAGAPRPEDTIARVQAIADELARHQPVDWEEDLACGGGPCLALGAERRSNPRASVATRFAISDSTLSTAIKNPRSAR